ncbi:MAG: magnesium/cobalt transporter CorA [Solirubrobacterales bacterium]
MIVACAHYKDGKRQHEGQLSLEQAASCVAGHTPGDFVWIGLHEPAPELLAEVGRRFDLHELALEDATLAHQRPKIEDYDESYFVVLRTARYDQVAEQVQFGEIHLFLGPGYVITVRHGEASELSSSRERLEARPELLALGPAAVIWAIVDKVVDDYFPVVDGIEDDIEEVETDVFDGDAPAPTSRIYFLKREVIEFYRAVGPLLGPLQALEEGAFTRIPEELRRYFRDVADHARRIVEQVSSQRELLTSVLEANLALVSVNQNEVVKKISSYAAIIAVPTFIASVYGMNFEHMPELRQVWGYPIALATMAVSVYLLYRYFKRVNWL